MQIRLIQQNHQGAFFALKNGVLNATGSWLGFVDADDCVDRKMYQLMLEKAKEFNADCVQCENYFIEDNGIKIENQRIKKVLVLERIEAMELFVNGTSIVRSGLCYKLYKKSFFNELEWIPSYLAEDTALMYQIFHQSNKFLCLPEMYYYTSRSSNSLTRGRFVIEKYDLHDVYDRMKMFFKKHKEYQNLIPYALNSQIGAIYHAAGEIYKSNITGNDRTLLRKRMKQDIKKILKYDKCSLKQKILLRAIYFFPWLYGLAYKFSRR